MKGRKWMFSILIFLTLVLPAIPALADPSDEGDFVPGEILVKFKNGVNSNEIIQTHAKYGLSILSLNTHAGYQRLKVAQGLSVLQIVEILNKNPIVEYAEPNYIAHACLAPNDPYYDYQWHLHAFAEGGINMEPAWDISTG